MIAGQGQSGAVPPGVDRALRRGAEAASSALSRWLGREARLAVSRVCLEELGEAVEALGPSDALVASCGIMLGGELPGMILMTFGGRSPLALVDSLLGQPPGTARDWGELERSAAQETANIVACAFVNVLAEEIGGGGPLVPGPPEFRLEFAGSLLQFALIDQASRSDRIVLVEARFEIDGVDNEASLVIVPTASGLEALGVSPESPPPSGGPGDGTSRCDP